MNNAINKRHETACKCLASPESKRVAHEVDELLTHWLSLRNELHALDRAVKDTTGNNEFSPSHWLVLLCLGRSGSMMQGELRASTSLQSAFLTRVLDDLGTHKLVYRERDVADRRQMRLRITSLGCAAIRAMYEAAAQRKECRVGPGTEQTELTS